MENAELLHPKRRQYDLETALFSCSGAPVFATSLCVSASIVSGGGGGWGGTWWWWWCVGGQPKLTSLQSSVDGISELSPQR